MEAELNTEVVLKKSETAITGKVKDLCAMAERAVIDSLEAYSKGVTLCKLIRDTEKAADTERLAITKPFRDGIDGINNRFKNMIDPISKAKKTIDKKMVDWKVAEDERLRKEAIALRQKEVEEAKAKAEALAVEGDLDGADSVMATAEKTEKAPVVAETISSVTGAAGGSASTRDVWKFRIVDQSKIPAEYFILDEKKISGVVRAGVREIPGLEIYAEQTLVVR